MATSGTPYEGRDNVLVPKIYTSASGYDIRLYTNTANSLGVSTVLANLTYVSGSSYAHLSLAGAWVSSNGVVTYDDGTPDNPKWTNNDAAAWGGTAVGVAMTDGTYVLHFKDFASPIDVGAGESVEIDISTLVG